MAEKAEEVRQVLNREASKVISRMDDLKRKGLSYSIVKSSAPVVTRLGFRSPYGYGVAALVVDFDYCARVLKSAQKRDLLSTNECHAILHYIKKLIRSVFERVVYFQRYLAREEMKPMSRNDFLPGADTDAEEARESGGGNFRRMPQGCFQWR